MNKKTRVSIPQQKPEDRIKNFEEVALGYSSDMVLEEAMRCIQCKEPVCIKGCPIAIDIPALIKKIKEKDFKGAIDKIKEKNSLPAICGRVCPQEDQCEKVCILAKKGDPVAIGRLERFAADWERKENKITIPTPTKKINKKVAIIGSGPAGLTAAGDLAHLGYKVIIFEALHKPGGVLVYGIPEFRLPKSIVEAEVDYVKKLGVEIKLNYVIGKIFTIEDLFNQGYEAIFIAIGAGLPMFQNIPGEDLHGVYSANEFLTRVNLMKAYRFPEYDTPVKIGKKTAVIGGGNVAMDSARCTLRLGSEVTVVYRRTENELPARKEEYENALAEGIKFQFLTLPIEMKSNGSDTVGSLVCQKMKLSDAPDSSGRKRPIPIPNSEFSIDVDTVIVAIGTSANPLLPKVTQGLKLNEKGYIVVDENYRTSIKGVWAGGDITTGSATVIEAMGAARIASQDIFKFLNSAL